MVELNFSVTAKGGGKVRISKNDGLDPGEAVVTLEGSAVSSAIVPLHELAMAIRAVDEMVMDRQDHRTRQVWDRGHHHGQYRGQQRPYRDRDDGYDRDRQR